MRRFLFLNITCCLLGANLTAEQRPNVLLIFSEGKELEWGYLEYFFGTEPALFTTPATAKERKASNSR